MKTPRTLAQYVELAEDMTESDHKGRWLTPFLHIEIMYEHARKQSRPWIDTRAETDRYVNPKAKG